MELPSIIYKIFKVLVIVDLVLLNGFVYYLFNRPAAAPQIIQQITQVLPSPTPSVLPSPLPTPTPVVIYKTAPPVPKTKVRSIYYVSVPGSGSTLNNDWADLSGTDFYFNNADYPGLTEVYFEVNSHLMNGNGKVFVRLFDVSHGIGVQGSEVWTASQTSELNTSGLVSFWTGKNLIRVQVKSLTADTAIFDSGRLRIVTEN